MPTHHFDQWLEYHCTAYPALADWLEENHKQVAFWRRLLCDFSLEQLTAATDALFASSTQPGGYGNHARAIRRIVLDSAGGSTSSDTPDGPSVCDGVLVADCYRCMDYGTIEVLSPQCLRDLMHDSQPSPVWRTCMIACDCERGARKSKTLRIPQYATGHCLVDIQRVMDRAIDVLREHQDVDHAMWYVARDMLQEAQAAMDDRWQDASTTTDHRSE